MQKRYKLMTKNQLITTTKERHESQNLAPVYSFGVYLSNVQVRCLYGLERPKALYRALETKFQALHGIDVKNVDPKNKKRKKRGIKSIVDK